MAKGELPDPVIKREVVFGKRQWNLATIECGKLCVENGQYVDALLYFLKAEAMEKIEELKLLAIEEGNAFLLGHIEKLLIQEPDKDMWKTLEKNAHKHGKFAYEENAKKILKVIEGGE